VKIDLGRNVERIRDQLRQFNLNIRGLNALIDESWEFAESNHLYVSAENDTERLFCLKASTYGGRALFLRIKQREDDTWECVYVLHRNKTDLHPIDERDPWNQKLFLTFPDLASKLEEMTAVQDEAWQPPAAEAIGPEELDKNEVIALVEHTYGIYGERPYLPSAFGLGEETWKKDLVNHILSTYAQQRKGGCVYEITSYLYLCDIGLTNVNREYLYLIIQTDQVKYDLCPARLVRNLYTTQKDAIYRVVNGLHQNQKDYPLLTQWAYIDYTYYERDLYPALLSETWCFSNELQSKESEIKAIQRYLENTFVRLLWEDKVLVFSDHKCRAQSLEDAEWASFNTGLVDKTYRPIFAVLHRNDPDKPKILWKLIGFDVADGGSMVNIPQIPERAKYFGKMRDMFYDFTVSNAKNPAIRTDHILIENFDRLPVNVQKKYLGKDCQKYQELVSSNKNPETLLESRSKAKSKLIGCFQLALKKALCRAEWNYRTGVPMYYIREGTMTILLPIALEQELQDDWEGDEDTSFSCDLALVMSCINEGGEDKYTAKTILALDKAYSNSRLVTRPDSDWLSPKVITTSQSKDED
jgi:hypothetical protein